MLLSLNRSKTGVVIAAKVWKSGPKVEKMCFKLRKYEEVIPCTACWCQKKKHKCKKGSAKHKEYNQKGKNNPFSCPFFLNTEFKGHKLLYGLKKV
jgi:hypothetical protein